MNFIKKLQLRFTLFAETLRRTHFVEFLFCTGAILTACASSIFPVPPAVSIFGMAVGTVCAIQLKSIMQRVFQITEQQAKLLPPQPKDDIALLGKEMLETQRSRLSPKDIKFIEQNLRKNLFSQLNCIILLDTLRGVKIESTHNVTSQSNQHDRIDLPNLKKRLNQVRESFRAEKSTHDLAKLEALMKKFENMDTKKSNSVAKELFEITPHSRPEILNMHFTIYKLLAKYEFNNETGNEIKTMKSGIYKRAISLIKKSVLYKSYLQIAGEEPGETKNTPLYASVNAILAIARNFDKQSVKNVSQALDEAETNFYNTVCRTRQIISYPDLPRNNNKVPVAELIELRTRAAHDLYLNKTERKLPLDSELIRDKFTKFKEYYSRFDPSSMTQNYPKQEKKSLEYYRQSINFEYADWLTQLYMQVKLYLNAEKTLLDFFSMNSLQNLGDKLSDYPTWLIVKNISPIYVEALKRTGANLISWTRYQKTQESFDLWSQNECTLERAATLEDMSGDFICLIDNSNLIASHEDRENFSKIFIDPLKKTWNTPEALEYLDKVNRRLASLRRGANMNCGDLTEDELDTLAACGICPTLLAEVYKLVPEEIEGRRRGDVAAPQHAKRAPKQSPIAAQPRPWSVTQTVTQIDRPQNVPTRRIGNRGATSRPIPTAAVQSQTLSDEERNTLTTIEAINARNENFGIIRDSRFNRNTYFVLDHQDGNIPFAEWFRLYKQAPSETHGKLVNGMFELRDPRWDQRLLGQPQSLRNNPIDTDKLKALGINDEAISFMQNDQNPNAQIVILNIPARNHTKAKLLISQSSGQAKSR